MVPLPSHPLQDFIFCPHCGSKRFLYNDERSRRCADCGFTYYANASAATVAVIINARGELLVARRAKNPAKGTLDLPGGFIDPGETAEEGMRREIEEETGLKVEQIQYLFSSPNVYLYSGMGVHTLDMDYIARVPEDIKVHAGDDAAECVWIPLDEVNPAEFGLPSIRHAVIRFLAQRTP